MSQPESYAADQIVNYTFKGAEYAVRLAGSGAKNLAVLIHTILKENPRSKGLVTLQRMSRDGHALKVFQIAAGDSADFAREAKRYGILYAAVRDKSMKQNGEIDIIVRAEDAARLNRVIEQLRLSAVDKGSATIEGGSQGQNEKKRVRHSGKQRGNAESKEQTTASANNAIAETKDAGNRTAEQYDSVKEHGNASPQETTKAPVNSEIFNRKDADNESPMSARRASRGKPRVPSARESSNSDHSYHLSEESSGKPNMEISEVTDIAQTTNQRTSVRSKMQLMQNDENDRFRRESNRLLMETAMTSNNAIVRSKYITLSVQKKNIDEARSYFARKASEMQAQLNILGSFLTDLDAKERLRIFHDIFRVGHEAEYNPDFAEQRRRGHHFADGIAPDYFEKIGNNAMKLGDSYARVLFMRDFATYIKDRMICELCDLQRPMVLSIDILPIPTEEAIAEAQRRVDGVATKGEESERRRSRCAARNPQRQRSEKDDIQRACGTVAAAARPEKAAEGQLL